MHSLSLNTEAADTACNMHEDRSDRFWLGCLGLCDIHPTRSAVGLVLDRSDHRPALGPLVPGVEVIGQVVRHAVYALVVCRLPLLDGGELKRVRVSGQHAHQLAEVRIVYREGVVVAGLKRARSLCQRVLGHRRRRRPGHMGSFFCFFFFQLFFSRTYLPSTGRIFVHRVDNGLRTIIVNVLRRRQTYGP